MTPAPSGELPEPVLERLSQAPRVALTVGEDPTTATHVAVAPLSRQTFLLVPRGSPTEASLLDEPRVTISSEDPKGEWMLRVTGRAVVSRPVNSEPRRAELLFWMPEGASPMGVTAARLLPETLEFVTGKGGNRSRAAGPVPGGHVPGAAARWGAMAVEGAAAGLYLVAGFLDWGGLLLLVEEADRSIVLLLLMVLCSAFLLGGATVLEQSARLVRWREGLADDAEIGRAHV